MEQLCPQYMAVGMSYDEFWNGDYEAAKMYREAARIKAEMRNHDAWLQGGYVYDAIGAWVPLMRAFSKAKKPEPYPKEPYGMTHERPLTEEEKEDLAHKKDDARFQAYMAEWMSAVNKSMAKKKAGETDGRSENPRN